MHYFWFMIFWRIFFFFLSGLIELRGGSLNLQGNVFKACGQEEAVALLEGRADYDGGGGGSDGDNIHEQEVCNG